jgi:hypothetical protein
MVFVTTVPNRLNVIAAHRRVNMANKLFTEDSLKLKGFRDVHQQGNIMQGILTEMECSVQLTSSLSLLVL